MKVCEKTIQVIGRWYWLFALALGVFGFVCLIVTGGANTSLFSALSHYIRSPWCWTGFIVLSLLYLCWAKSVEKIKTWRGLWHGIDRYTKICILAIIATLGFYIFSGLWMYFTILIAAVASLIHFLSDKEDCDDCMC